MLNKITWWEFTLLALAAFRTFKLLAFDVVLDRPRDWLVGRNTWEAKEHYRGKLDDWIHCPWCFGFWISLAWWGAWQAWPHGTIIVAVPLALNAVMALVAKRLDP